MQVPVNHIKNNRSRFILPEPTTPSSLTSGSYTDKSYDIFKQKKNSLSSYRVRLISPIEIEKRKLNIEREKIKNIIGNNPFKVKNYVQGDDLNNDLVPLKLLKKKEVKFTNDDDFIQHFLAEKKK